jgi:prevent-host-death family protein
MVMKVGVAQLKAHLSEHLRRVQDGETIVVTDRERPVAKIVPYAQETSGIVIRKPQGKKRLQDIELPEPVDLGGLDPVEILLELRKDRF